VSHLELAKATATTASLKTSKELMSIFRNPFWSSEDGPLSLSNVRDWLELIRLNDDEIIRRTRGADTARSTSVMRAYPPNSIWGIRLRKAPVVSKVNVNHKRKDVLLPLTNNGKPKTIGITSKHMKLEKVGIRLFTQPRKILVTNYIGRKKTRKYATCMLSVFDESEDPAKSPTVMRLEIMHPESGEMVVLRLGPSVLKRALMVHSNPNRFQIAEVMVGELMLTEFIDAHSPETLPPRMLTLRLKEKKVSDEIKMVDGSSSSNEEK
tara:strand:- start:64 stop:861 length:798 start_codon:yes stop_codon:yes gene_type:complete